MNMADQVRAVARGGPIFRKEDCSPLDIGAVLDHAGQFSDAEKLHFIENVWSPRDPLFEFPSTVESGKSRKFQRAWLQQYSWLAYSKYLDGAFCLPCVLFGRGATVAKLMKSPITCWTSATSRFKKHSNGKCETHNTAVLAMDNFVRVMKRQIVPINEQLDTLLQQQIDTNRKILSSLLKTVIFCGRNNIALRGHRDDKPGNSASQGNFRALLAFRVDSGDETLQQHLENAPRNATYTSKTIQNEMITTVGKYLLDKLSCEMKGSKYFSILADEAADISNKENLSIVIRFVDASNSIREDFVGYHLCKEGTTGVAIKNIILKAVSDLGLSMDDCRGQCYDGAGNMAGQFNGASALIKQQYEKAIYVHCMSHRLNLCVADTCSLTLVRNMMGVVKKLSDFFSNSPKRQDYLIKKIEGLLPGSNHHVLIDVCRTRWIARIDGMDRIVELLLPVFSTLEDISLNRDAFGNQQWNYNSRNDAQSLVNAINFSFIVTVVVVKHILGLTRPLTVKLQRKEADLMKAKDEIDSLKSILTDMQANINDRHHTLYDEAVELAHSIQIEPCMPRLTQRQIYRANAPAQTPEDYYRINLTIVFLDHALQQLNTRFQDQVFVCYKGLSIIPSHLLEHPQDWKDHVMEFCQNYRQDIPNAAGLEAELILWERLWKDKEGKKEDIPDRISFTLKFTDKECFVNIFAILQVLATIPITSSSCERSISVLRNLKNYLRSTMSHDRLNGLAIMHAHADVNLNLGEIIDLFANLHPRRMRMANILQD